MTTVLKTVFKCIKQLKFRELIFRGRLVIASNYGTLKLSPEELHDLIKILKSNGFKIRAIINECDPSYYPYINNKMWNLIWLRCGIVGNDYESLMRYLQIGNGTEVFFEKNIND